MTVSSWSDKRYLVPRWRNFSQTLINGELSELPKVHNHIRSTYFEDKVRNWKFDSNVITASELVRASIVEACEEDAIDAAEYLVSQRSKIRPMLFDTASHVLSQSKTTEKMLIRPIETRDNDSKRFEHEEQKRLLKLNLKVYPRNPIAWVELSLLNLFEGRYTEAEKNMLVATTIAPYNRYVIRSAARLYLHINELEKSYDLVANCARTPSDPWLMAAEISLAQVNERAPRFYKIARKIVAEKNINLKQISELSGALGTFELSENNDLKARRYFRLSIIEPTGSSMAQAHWVTLSKKMKLTEDYPTVSNEYESAEARTFYYLNRYQLDEALKLCEIWSSSEVYSIRPFETGASILCSLGKIDEALKFMVRGFKLGQSSKTLNNNMAFSLAHKQKF